MKIIIYTDGASRGNPGHSSYGFSIKDDKGRILYEEGKYIGIATNNFAEYSAVLNAMDYVSQNFPKSVEVNFFMDSKLVAEQLSGRYKIKSPNLIALIYKIKDFQDGIKEITYTHVPREQNKIADALANQALDSR